MCPLPVVQRLELSAGGEITVEERDRRKSTRRIQTAHFAVVDSEPNGSYIFFIRSGWKPIEFEKGKAAIAGKAAVSYRDAD